MDQACALWEGDEGSISQIMRSVGDPVTNPWPSPLRRPDSLLRSFPEDRSAWGHYRKCTTREIKARCISILKTSG